MYRKFALSHKKVDIRAVKTSGTYVGIFIRKYVQLYVCFSHIFLCKIITNVRTYIRR